VTKLETAEILAGAMLIDNRKAADEYTIKAWHELIGDFTLAECKAALVDYYKTEREMVMPSDIRSRVLGDRQQWLQSHPNYGPQHPELIPPWQAQGALEA
jgi:hypothetical protein